MQSARKRKKAMAAHPRNLMACMSEAPAGLIALYLPGKRRPVCLTPAQAHLTRALLALPGPRPTQTETTSSGLSSSICGSESSA